MKVYQIENYDSMFFDNLDYAIERLMNYTEEDDNVSEEDWEIIRTIEEDELPYKVGGFTLKIAEMSEDDFDGLEKQDVFM